MSFPECIMAVWKFLCAVSYLLSQVFDLILIVFLIGIFRRLGRHP